MIQKSNGVHAKAGFHDVVLDADLAGILAHEAIGHTTEADLVMGGSVAKDFLNKSVATDLVTLTDYAHSIDDKLCPVPVFVDDEGTVYQRLEGDEVGEILGEWKEGNFFEC